MATKKKKSGKSLSFLAKKTSPKSPARQTATLKRKQKGPALSLAALAMFGAANDVILSLGSLIPRKDELKKKLQQAQDEGRYISSIDILLCSETCGEHVLTLSRSETIGCTWLDVRLRTNDLSAMTVVAYEHEHREHITNRQNLCSDTDFQLINGIVRGLHQRFAQFNSSNMVRTHKVD